MVSKLLTNSYLRLAVLFFAMPALFYMAVELPERIFLKESLSLLVIVSFSLMIGQFFLSRCGRRLLPDMKMGKVVRVHKISGYCFIPVLLVHPFLIVVPRYYEAGVEPMDAFITMITTLESSGVVLGLCSWFLLLVIGLTSYFRNQLFKSYLRWRSVHGVLSILFVITGLWHALELGRHMNGPLSLLFIACSTVGILFFATTLMGINKVQNDQEIAA